MVKKKSIKGTTQVQVPEGVKILVAVTFVAALVSFIAGGFLFSFSDTVSNNAAVFVEQGLAVPTSGELIFFGIALLGLAILEYFIARNLLKLKNWARMVLIIFAVFGIITAVINLTEQLYASGIYSLLLNGLIVWYLAFRKETVKAFR